MAATCPDEGLDFILGQFPFNTAKYTSPLNLALFTSQTASTVITHAQTIANITETTTTSYARQSLAAATWGAAAERPTNLGRQQTYPQVTFPTVGATGADDQRVLHHQQRPVLPVSARPTSTTSPLSLATNTSSKSPRRSRTSTDATLRQKPEERTR